MGVAGLLLVAGALATAGIGQASGNPAPLVFSGEATASGVRVTIQAPDAPLTNTPFDAGAPTGYAQLDTIGGTSAYAAYPFPGALFQSGPGIAVGLLNQSGVPVPSPPGFPNYVASDGTTPSAESGSGPYHLKATSSPTKADALATGGIKSDGGNAGLATATATVESLGAAAGAVATALSTNEALTIGPLTIGSVRSRVTVNLAPDGTATPTTELAVSGVEIAGVPISVTQDGLAAGGATVPFTTDPALTAALAQAGLGAELVAGRQLEKGAIAPAVRITAPVPTPGLGDGTGEMILVLGGASAAFSSFVAPIPDLIPPVTGDTFGGGTVGGADGNAVSAGDDADSLTSGPSNSTGAGSARAGSTGGGSAGFTAPAGEAAGNTDSAAGSGSRAAPSEIALRPGGSAAGAPAGSLRELSEPFDIRHLDLVASALTFLTLGLATLLRHLGVRSA
jgi:hypothetical protein